jgi:hypothetical protein
MLTEATVKTLIDNKGTKIATVTFIKKDGSTRIVNGLFRPTSQMVGSQKGLAQGEAMKARGQVPIWSIAEKAWKSFFLDSVVEIK